MARTVAFNSSHAASQEGNGAPVAAACRLVACILHNPKLTQLDLDHAPSACVGHAAWQGERLPVPPSEVAAKGWTEVLEFLRKAKASNFKRELQDTHVKSKAVAVPSHHLPSLAMASLPPLTHACGEPGASGSVFKIEYQGKPAAAKRFHEHMRGMLGRELKWLQLLAHPNIVRVMAVITDAAAQPVGFIMECVRACASVLFWRVCSRDCRYMPVPLDEAMQRMTLRQALHALSEAAIGIAVAHDTHVIHR